MRLAFAVVSLFATQALAEDGLVDGALMEFLGGDGCTIGPANMNSVAQAGFTAAITDTAIGHAAGQGLGTQQGAYFVFGPKLCTIRLPDIQSEWSVDSPEIQAAAPYVRDVFELGDEQIVSEGCFLTDGFDVFVTLNDGDVDAGNADYLNFLAAGIISGQARFYSPSPLETPLGFQILAGKCASAPNMSDITPSHTFIASGFDRYVREVGAATVCGDGLSTSSMGIIADIQGFDGTSDQEPRPPFNAWLFIEYDIITMAAGWHEGQSGADRGQPRPPLCHVPD